MNYPVPGLYKEEIFLPPAPPLLTGVPLFIGYAAAGDLDAAQLLTEWPQFAARFGAPRLDGHLADAVHGFFANDGLICYGIRLEETDPGQPRAQEQALQRALAAAVNLNRIDLLCAPDLMWGVDPQNDADLQAVTDRQARLLDHCRELGDRLAILDGVMADAPQRVLQQGELLRAKAPRSHAWGAIYSPWLWAMGHDEQCRYVPPSGHVAGVYARSDQQTGVHKAPANEPLAEVLDLRGALAPAEAAALHAGNVNCVLALPGRGIRVWGARTLSSDPTWRYVSTRRVVITASRWIERFMEELVYEPNDIRLWVRILRELTAYLEGLFLQGALKGRIPEEAFFVKCDDETNPPAVMEAGMVVTLIGLALAAPAEFVVLRIVHGASGVRIQAAMEN